MDSQTIARIANWGGALLGAILGFLGGGIGCYFSIKNTQGPRERAFVIKACVVCWLLVAAFILGLWLIPGIYKAVLGVAYVVVLIAGIARWNRRQAQIRSEEARSKH